MGEPTPKDLETFTRLRDDQLVLSTAVRDFCLKNPSFSGASLSVPLQFGAVALVNIKVDESRQIGRRPVAS